MPNTACSRAARTPPAGCRRLPAALRPGCLAGRGAGFAPEGRTGIAGAAEWACKEQDLDQQESTPLSRGFLGVSGSAPGSSMRSARLSSEPGPAAREIACKSPGAGIHSVEDTPAVEAGRLVVGDMPAVPGRRPADKPAGTDKPAAAGTGLAAERLPPFSSWSFSTR